jgi:hypothetical protein
MAANVSGNSNGSSIKKTFSRVLMILALLIVLSFTIFYFVAGFTYSEGIRAGLLIKFSSKGYLIKTYEGEINVGGLQQADKNIISVNNIWTFSVKDAAVAQKLMNVEGRYVSLHYKEVIHNFFWQGETKYFVDGVEVIKE